MSNCKICENRVVCDHAKWNKKDCSAYREKHGECRTCKHYVIGQIDGKTYVCEHPEIQLEHYYDYACIMMDDNDFCSRYEAKEGENNESDHL